MQKYSKTLYATRYGVSMPDDIRNSQTIFKLVEYYMSQSDTLKVNVTIIEYGDSTYVKYLVYVSGDDKMKRWLETFTSINMRNNIHQIDVYNSKEKVNKFVEERAGEFI